MVFDRLSIQFPKKSTAPCLLRGPTVTGPLERLQRLLLAHFPKPPSSGSAPAKFLACKASFQNCSARCDTMLLRCLKINSFTKPLPSFANVQGAHFRLCPMLFPDCALPLSISRKICKALNFWHASCQIWANVDVYPASVEG